MELVLHYRQESLKEHNPHLDIRLLFPVKAADNSTYQPVYLFMHQNP